MQPGRRAVVAALLTLGVFTVVSEPRAVRYRCQYLKTHNRSGIVCTPVDAPASFGGPKPKTFTAPEAFNSNFIRHRESACGNLQRLAEQLKDFQHGSWKYCDPTLCLREVLLLSSIISPKPSVDYAPDSHGPGDDAVFLSAGQDYTPWPDPIAVPRLGTFINLGWQPGTSTEGRLLKQLQQPGQSGHDTAAEAMTQIRLFVQSPHCSKNTVNTDCARCFGRCWLMYGYPSISNEGVCQGKSYPCDSASCGIHVFCGGYKFTDDDEKKPPKPVV